MHIPDGYLSPQTCAALRRGDGPVLDHRGAARAARS